MVHDRGPTGPRRQQPESNNTVPPSWQEPCVQTCSECDVAGAPHPRFEMIAKKHIFEFETVVGHEPQTNGLKLILFEVLAVFWVDDPTIGIRKISEETHFRI
jgi:hypothetical protein